MGKTICVVLFCLAFAACAYAERPGSFSLSTARTYAPDEKPKLHLYARNEDTLEFRVYRVEDAEKFFTRLSDLHRFSTETPVGGAERVDEQSWLEKFHDWKHAMWWRVRHFFRDQLSYETRSALREKQAAMGRRSRVLSEAEFAQIPVLNNRQLVSRWRLQLPPTFVSDSQDLPIDPLPAGVYLIEATDGHLKAYTVLIISQMAMLTRPKGGELLAYCVDRKTGAPIAGVNVVLSSRKQPAARAATGGDGLAKLPYSAPVEGADDSSYLILARHGSDVAAVTPWAYAMRDESGARMLKYIYTDRPVYRPGHTVHWKAILREKQADHLIVPAGRSVHVRIQSPEGEKVILEKDMVLSQMGSINGDVTLADNAALGYYTISVGTQDSGFDGSFYVEEYKKPEYKVTVALDKNRVLQGEAFHATIEAKYFFGEPVANAKVKYAIYHTPHYWWDASDDGGGDATAASPDAEGGADSDDQYFSGEQEQEQEDTLDANGRLTITVKTRFDEPHHQDLDYRIEARVVDAAKREVSGVKYGLATYGSFRVQVEPTSWVYQPDQTPEIKVQALDYDQKPVQTRVHLAAFRRAYKDGKWSEEHLAGDVDVATDASGFATVKMPIAQRGSIEVRATAETPEHRNVQSSAWLWLVGGNSQDFGRQDQTARILADMKIYKPGDVAHLSLVADVDDPWVLVTTSGGSLQSARVMQAHGRTLTFDVPITVEAQPNLSVRAVFVRENQVYQAQK
ncbi:MAG TPA: MG2 domain-containing protein, partial [Acidobacteriaceae bacterium]|nr:MG2 domain-containing protein [Acidobacteriaceae bacterium]